jgi:hypothetical protein
LWALVAWNSPFTLKSAAFFAHEGEAWRSQGRHAVNSYEVTMSQIIGCLGFMAVIEITYPETNEQQVSLAGGEYEIDQRGTARLYARAKALSRLSRQ